MRTELRNCSPHGVYESREWRPGLWSGCPHCETERQRQQEEERKRGERASRVNSMLAASGLEGRYLSTTFENFRVDTPAKRAVLDTCRAYAKDFPARPGDVLWLLGTPGTGKTHLGAAIVRTVIEQHLRHAVITTPRRIVRRLRETWRRDAEESEREVIDDYAGYSLMVLDEVGTTFGTDAELVQLFDVLDARYVAQQRTLVLSNLPSAKLKENLGDRLFDRLREGARVLPMAWASYRAGVVE